MRAIHRWPIDSQRPGGCFTTLGELPKRVFVASHFVVSYFFLLELRSPIRGRHITFNTDFTAHLSPWTNYSRIYNLPKTYLKSSSWFGSNTLDRLSIYRGTIWHDIAPRTLTSKVKLESAFGLTKLQRHLYLALMGELWVSFVVYLEKSYREKSIAHCTANSVVTQWTHYHAE